MSEPAIYRRRDFTFFISSRFLATVAMMVQSVAIGWQVYDIERTPLSLGLVGLCQFLPMFLFTLPAGEISDRFDQRRVLAIAQAMQGVCAALFLVFSILARRNAVPFYAVLVLFGIARGFSGPAGSSLLAFLVPPEKLARGIALSSSAFTTAVIAGPALGGFLYALGPVPTYGVCFAGFMLAAVCTATLGGRRIVHLPGEATRLERVIEGIRFVRERPIVMGAISLDLFAVLLGGAVALLPIYARDILHVGPVGLGWLR
ncbi:MAG: MFS transporter, partial [Rhizomicrobium sp.]